ncbi:cytochrome P450 306a1 [Drosophila tropicalis]|uniref:cytochrome P450 306a1 n=1 Tax=Drosophila tropicalis TaxID=46794 RepID=UPI0035ABDE84
MESLESMESSWFNYSLSLLLGPGLLLILIMWICEHQHDNILGKRPPGPWGIPLLGYLPFLNAKQPHKSLQKLAEYYENGIFQLRMGGIQTVVLSDAQLVREFFRHEELTARAPLYLTHGIMGGYGIICAAGAIWKHQRRQIIDWLKALGMSRRPSEMRKQLEQRIGLGVDECVQLYARQLETEVEFDPLPALQHTLGNIINDLVFGLKYERDDTNWLYLQQLQEEGVKLIGVSGMVNFVPWLRHLSFNKKNIKFLLDGKSKTHDIYDRIVNECEERMKENAGQPPRSILEHFLRERQPHSELYCQEQLRHLLADLFGAGVDTALATLRWFLLYMACNPNIQRQLRSHLKHLSSTPSLEELEPLTYLRACISEVQRIRSVVPLGIPHGTEKDINIAGYRIQKGSMIVSLQWAIHMNPEHWPQPEEFRPNRFLNDEDEYVAPAQFIPFQNGKRMCPGDELARMMLTLFAGRILRKFQLEMIDDYADMNMDGECGITLAPAAYKLKFIPVDEESIE